MRVRAIFILVCGVMMTGCASRAAKPVPVATSQPVEREYVVANAGCLAFDAPLRAYRSSPDLSREPRRASAYGGFDELNVTFTNIVIDDNQGMGCWNWGDGYQRQVYSVQSKISYR